MSRTSMTSSVSVRSLRRASVARAAALLLIALIASPFTAPFSTFDIAELADDGSSQNKLPGSKLADASTPAVECISTTACWSIIVHRVGDKPPRLAPHPALSTVLRL